MLITPASDLASASADDLIEVGLDVTALPAGTPAEAWAHLAVYAARPDIAAIARAQPPAAFAAAAALAGAQRPGEPTAALAGTQRPGDRARAAARWDPATLRQDAATVREDAGAEPGCLPLLHGQACWLGERVPVHGDARLMRSPALGAAAATTLGQSHALLLRGNGALTCGDTPEVAATRMWLLAVACQTWLTAAAAGTPRPIDPDEAASWRAVQDELLPRLWLHLNRP
jgi:HCOMODA/2-hydroxy-3-carboxy-muconic semialdehyde decarboxylase